VPGETCRRARYAVSLMPLGLLVAEDRCADKRGLVTTYSTCGIHVRQARLPRWLFSPIVVVATLAVGVVVWLPPGAFACSGGPSAVNVYAECVATASGDRPMSSAAGSAQQTVSPRATRAVDQAGKDRALLAHLLRIYGSPQLPGPSSSNSAAAEPGALRSAFHLGSGPAAFLIVLAGTAFLLLGGRGLRLWRPPHHT
jgi:hypothetical protein